MTVASGTGYWRHNPRMFSLIYLWFFAMPVYRAPSATFQVRDSARWVICPNRSRPIGRAGAVIRNI